MLNSTSYFDNHFYHRLEMVQTGTLITKNLDLWQFVTFQFLAKEDLKLTHFPFTPFKVTNKVFSSLTVIL